MPFNLDIVIIKFDFLKKICVGILCILFIVSCDTKDTNHSKPNVLFILADDLGWADLPAYGNSFLPELLGNKHNPERAIFWHYPVCHHDVPASAVRKGDWKLIENLVSGEVELYNLKSDISEDNDLSATYTGESEELKQVLKQWQQEVKAEFPVPNPQVDESRRYEWGKHS